MIYSFFHRLVFLVLGKSAEAPAAGKDLKKLNLNCGVFPICKYQFLCFN